MNLLNGRYRRSGRYESGVFEEDLLVMHKETMDTMVLNPPAAAIWEALKWPQSVSDLTELLSEAFPEENEEALRSHVKEVLEALLSQEFLLKV